MNTIQSNMLLKHIYPQLLPIYRYMKGMGVIMITLPLIEWAFQTLFPFASMCGANSFLTCAAAGFGIGFHMFIALTLFGILKYVYQPQKELLHPYAYRLINYFAGFAAAMVAILAMIGYAPYIAPALLIACGIFFSLYTGQFSESDTQFATWVISVPAQYIIQGTSGIVLITYNMHYIWLPLIICIGIFMMIMNTLMAKILTKKMHEISELPEQEGLAAAASPERAQALEQIQEIQRSLGGNFATRISSDYMTTIGVVCITMVFYELFLSYILAYITPLILSQPNMTEVLLTLIVTCQKVLLWNLLCIWLLSKAPKPSEHLHPFAQNILRSCGKIFPILALAVAGVLTSIGQTSLIAPFMLIFAGCIFWLYGQFSLKVMQYTAFGFFAAGLAGLYLTTCNIPHLWMYLCAAAGLTCCIVGRIVKYQQ